MDTEEFRRRGKDMIDWVADYMENIRDRKVSPDVEPGYLQRLIPDRAPDQPEKWEDLYSDIERVIMPGMLHWASPQFHGYLTVAMSYPAVIADILSSIAAGSGMSWASNPVLTELEVVVVDWLVKMLKLPKHFLSGGKGGGVIQGTASESTLVALLAARSRAVGQEQQKDPGATQAEIMSKLVAYTSDQAHSSVQRACTLGTVRCHMVTSDDKCQMRGDALAAAITKDRDKGLLPFYVVATLGTTTTCAYDNLLEIGPVCDREIVWLHIDAAYAGASFICPEFRPRLDGVEHWQISLERRFRSLKLWFVIRLYGISGLQAQIRKYVELAMEFKDKMAKDVQFELIHEVTLSLVCFKLKEVGNDCNSELNRLINEDGRIHMTPGEAKGIHFLRFVIGSTKTESGDIDFALGVIKEITGRLVHHTP